jgi:phage tail-like protein
VFKRGITNSDALFNWVNESSGETFASNGNKLTRRTGAVSVLDYSGNPLRSWTLISPFPVKWTGPRLSSRESNVLDEEIEIAHQGFKSKTFKPS